MSAKPSPKSFKQPPPRPGRSLPGALYWLIFIGCAGVSFGAGFWFTYRYTSQVNVRGPETAVAPLVPLATPVPAAVPVPIATPQDLFAAEPAATPPPTPVPEPSSTPQPVAPLVEPTATPAPAPTDDETEPTVEPTAEDVYQVQVGSYDTRGAAETMVQELLDAGIEAVVVFDQSQYHAQVGAYNSKERALEVADEVNAKGYAVTIRH